MENLPMQEILNLIPSAGVLGAIAVFSVYKLVEMSKNFTGQLEITTNKFFENLKGITSKLSDMDADLTEIKIHLNDVKDGRIFEKITNNFLENFNNLISKISGLYTDIDEIKKQLSDIKIG